MTPLVIKYGKRTYKVKPFIKKKKKPAQPNFLSHKYHFLFSKFLNILYFQNILKVSYELNIMK